MWVTMARAVGTEQEERMSDMYGSVSAICYDQWRSVIRYLLIIKILVTNSQSL